MRRTLSVRLIGCRDLLAADKGGTSDPYVTMNLLEKGTGKQIKKETFKSKTLKKTLAPVYNATHVFGETYDLDAPAGQLPSLELKVYDSDNFSSEPLGFTVQPLSSFSEITKEKLFTYKLEAFGKMKEAKGEIEFTAAFSRPETKVEVAEEVVVDINDPPLVIPPEILDANPAGTSADDKSPNSLHVLICQAKNIKIMDSAGMFKKGPGSSDPICTVSVGKEKVASKVQKKNLNPVWNETFVLKHSNPGDLIKIQIDDYDMGSGNDFIGAVKIPVKDLQDRVENRIWRSLQTLEGEDDVKLGRVLVAFRWLHDPAFALENVKEAAAQPAVDVKMAELSEEDVALEKSFTPPLQVDDVKIDGKDLNELHVMVIKAKYIEAMDKSMFSGVKLPSLGLGKKKKKDKEKDPDKGKGTSDPFVEVKTTSNGKGFKTETIKKTLEPVWENNVFAIPESDPTGEVTLELRDSDMLTSEFMGKISVPMASLKARTEVRQWHDLLNIDGVIDKDRGKLLVALRWIYNPSILSEAEAVDKNDLGPPLEIDPEDKLIKPANRVHIFVIRARGLPVMDKNMFSSGGSSDPMVTLSYDEEKKKSKIVKKNLNPVWMERFYFDRVLSTISKNLVEIKVEDYDLAGNDFMGKVSIPLVLLKERKESRLWMKLENEKGTNDGKERGEILIAARWVYDPKANPPKVPGALDDLEDMKPRRISTVPKQKKRRETKVDAYIIPEPRVTDTYGNWQEIEEPQSKNIYWFNTVTRVSTWDEPGFVIEEKRRRMIKRVKEHTEKSLWNCDESAYHNFRTEVIACRDRAFRWLSRYGSEELHRHRMEKFMDFLLDQHKRQLGSAFRPWKELMIREEEHEREGAALEIQRVVRSWIIRRRHATTELGMQLHYIKVKVREFSLIHKEKMRMIMNGDGFALVGQMTLDALEDNEVDAVFEDMLEIIVDETAREMEVYEAEAERLRKEQAFDDALDAAFASDESSEEESEELEEGSSIPELDENGEPIKKIKEKKKKVKAKPMTALDLAIQRRKQQDLVDRGLADPSTLRRSLNDQDIGVAAERIEDNILTGALDLIIEEVEGYLNFAFGLETEHRDQVLNDCIRLWQNDPELTEVDYDGKRKPVVAAGSEVGSEAGSRDENDSTAGSSVAYFSEGEESDYSDEEALGDLDIGFSDEGAIAIACAIRDNTVIKSIKIRNHAVGDEGAMALSRALAHNDKVKELNLSKNRICNLGSQEIAKMMVRNDSIVKIDLRNNLVGDFGTRKLMLALRKNERIGNRKLLLKNNRVSVGKTLQKREVRLKLGFSKERTKIMSKQTMR
ncbi:hypothetical protein TrVE_jg4950 [Triparma verrucosa]|uniref:Uncharacterized protein n=1 Tax=Triparma verrucosa TaxID=1606542 RepID=A0A9W7FG07_9STRA|nr:hypothetical protein TrVE_jg4950 [Triparma verrucosa]